MNNGVRTSTNKTSNSVSNLVVGHGLADLLDYTSIVTPSKSAWRCRPLNALPVSWVQGYGLGLDKKPVVGRKLGQRDVIAQLRNAFGGANDCFLCRHVS